MWDHARKVSGTTPARSNEIKQSITTACRCASASLGTSGSRKPRPSAAPTQQRSTSRYRLATAGSRRRHPAPATRRPRLQAHVVISDSSNPPHRPRIDNDGYIALEKLRDPACPASSSEGHPTHSYPFADIGCHVIGHLAQS